MKNTILIFSLALITACAQTEEHGHEHEHGHAHGEGAEHVQLTAAQVNTLGIQIDSMHSMEMGTYITTNGELEVPPQNEASVSVPIGANIRSIKVLEGDKVYKGQVLGHVSHPDLIALQIDYRQALSNLTYLKTEFERTSELLENKAIALKDHQISESNYLAKKAEYAGLKAQAKLLGLTEQMLNAEEIAQMLAVVSPINGYIRLINVKIGQYVSPNFSMFEIVNIDHIHADLMVYEKDIHRIQKGQDVRFQVESLQGKTLDAKIYAVGKAFELDPKAIHLHAEIQNKEGLLLPGMYVRGKILTASHLVKSLPQDAVVIQDEVHYVFSLVKEGEYWEFEPLEVELGVLNDGWYEILNADELKNESIVQNQAYVLMAELKKEEAEHSH